jgi:hypothetical protein
LISDATGRIQTEDVLRRIFGPLREEVTGR